MLFVPYSSTILTMFWRIPDRIEATTMATVTPMTMPSMVKALRNLCDITLSSAIRSVSRGKNLGILSLMSFSQFRVSAMMGSRREALKAG